MALLQYRAPVKYAVQQEIFKDFLQTFKSFESASENAATEAIEGLHIDGDNTSDEYDFMDDVDGQQTGTARSKKPKLKYMQMLQEVADRTRSNILIELDDLETVGSTLGNVRSVSSSNYEVINYSTSNPCRMALIQTFWQTSKIMQNDTLMYSPMQSTK